MDIFDDFIHYSTDTMPGSSGSPVFNDEWMVVSLHHSGVPDPNKPGQFISNEGIRISSIMEFVMEQRSGFINEKKKLIDDVIDDWKPKEEREEEMLVEELSHEWYKSSNGYDPAFLGDQVQYSSSSFSK